MKRKIVAIFVGLFIISGVLIGIIFASAQADEKHAATEEMGILILPTEGVRIHALQVDIDSFKYAETEEEKEKDSTIISYANKKVRVTLPKDLTSFHTPAREISRYSYMEESNVLGYSLYAKDRTFTIHFSIGTDGWDSAEAASISHNKVCKDESKMYTSM